MDIKLTEIVRATTISLNIKDAPMTALPLIKDTFAKLATDLDMLFDPAKYEAVQEAPGHFVITYGVELQEEARQAAERIKEMLASGEDLGAVASTDPPKRRGRPPKTQKVSVPEPVEPTPLEQAIADKVQEDKEQQGEPTSAETVATPSQTTESATAAEPTSECEPVSDFDMNSYLARVCNQSKGASYKETIYEMAKQFAEEGAVARPSNIKGDDKRWAFIRAVEADSGVKYHG